MYWYLIRYITKECILKNDNYMFKEFVKKYYFEKFL